MNRHVACQTNGIVKCLKHHEGNVYLGHKAVARESAMSYVTKKRFDKEYELSCSQESWNGHSCRSQGSTCGWQGCETILLRSLHGGTFSYIMLYVETY